MATNVQGYNRESTTNVHLASAVDAILDTCLQKQNLGGYLAGLGASLRLFSTVYLTADRSRRSSPRQRNLQHRRPTHQMFRHTECTTYRDRMQLCSQYHPRKSREADLRAKTELRGGCHSPPGISRAQSWLSRLRHSHQCSRRTIDNGFVVALVLSGKHHKCDVYEKRQRRQVRRSR